MNKLIVKLFLLVFTGGSFASSTVIEEEFYGTWSTVSSVLNPKRQILELSPSGGRWIQRDDQGNDRILVLNKADITINDDLLIIDYKNPDIGFRLKLVLGGWAMSREKNIFGTVYMYRGSGQEFSLFNGIPISFKSGKEQIPPQAFWSFFSGTAAKREEKGYIEALEESLLKIEGISISESADQKEYSLKRIGAAISITKPENSAHPSAIGMRQSPDNPAIIETSAKYEGSNEAFQKYYQEYILELEKQKMTTLKFIEELNKKIEDSKSTQ